MNTIVSNALETERRKKHVVEFAARLVSGTIEQPYRLKLSPADVVRVLADLPEKKAEAVEVLLQSMKDSAIDLIENRGARRYAELSEAKPRLPEEYHPMLRAWLAAGKKLADFFAANTEELGKVEDYDLTEFME